MPIEMATEIDAYCARTDISKSKFVVKLLQASLSQVKESPAMIHAAVRIGER